jgi:isopentenyldiphosphate isomerase
MAVDPEERLALANRDGTDAGSALRSECHKNRNLIHRAVHIIVEDGQGRLILQKRSTKKQIQPGKWDTSVGGHVLAGEAIHSAAVRELEEELGITGAEPEPIYEYLWESPREREYVNTYRLVWTGKVKSNPEEIDEVKAWSIDEVEGAPQGIFTPNFLHELNRYRIHRGL